MTPLYDVKGFLGTVVLKEWTDGLDGRNYRSFHGAITIADASAAAGFEIRDRDASWTARVEGGSEAFVFPGCEVRAIHVGTLPREHRDVCIVGGASR